MNRMTFAVGDDWSGVYIGDVLMREGHSVDPVDAAIMAIEFKASGVVMWGVDVKWLEDRGDLPANINDVRWAELYTTPPTQVGAA